jgi:hypothetical protein
VRLLVLFKHILQKFSPLPSCDTSPCWWQHNRRQLEAKEAEAAAAAEVLAEVDVRVAATAQEFDGARERLAAERQALAADSAECDAAQAQVDPMRSMRCVSQLCQGARGVALTGGDST